MYVEDECLTYMVITLLLASRPSRDPHIAPQGGLCRPLYLITPPVYFVLPSLPRIGISNLYVSWAHD
jgi:hypothetical protein